ncbi:MAG: hypothetical protein M3174_06120 [Actinomycetota bacterium]|nr:hypothetical protein [Actinomycetota bacterium]
MIEGVVVTLVALFALTYVTGPLRRGRAPIRERSDEIVEADAEKRIKLGALIDLEEERFAGKLSQEDFDRLRRQYEAEAVEALNRLDSLQRTPIEDEVLESEIARVKARLKCPSCGAARSPGAPCPQCGA